MSKANKKVKAPVEGVNVMYRIVMALMAIAVPVAAVFCELIHFILESDVFAFIAQLRGDTGDDGSTEDGYSIYSFCKEVVPLFGNNKGSGSTIWESIAPVRTPLVCVVVFFALALVIAVVAFFFACFSNKKLPQMIISLCGLVSMVALYISFSKFSTPLTDGTVSLGSFFGSGLISAIIPYVASFSLLTLSTATTVMTILYVFMVVWTGAYMVIELGDDKHKKAKKTK